MEDNIIIGNTSGKEFTIIDLWISAIWNNASSLEVSDFKKVIPYEKLKEFKENDSFEFFEKALNWIEKNTDYTLFQIIPYETSLERRLKLIYIHK